jgi:hypothetical protein
MEPEAGHLARIAVGDLEPPARRVLEDLVLPRHPAGEPNRAGLFAGPLKRRLFSLRQADIVISGKGGLAMTDDRGRAEIPARYFAIALLPAAMFLINLFVLWLYADPPNPLPARIAEFAAYKEASARIGVLATLMLFAGAAVAALLFFFVCLRTINRQGRRIIGGCFLGLAVTAALSGILIKNRTTVAYAGSSLTRVAAAYDKERSDSARAAEKKGMEAGLPGGPSPAGAEGKVAPKPKKLADGVAVDILAKQGKPGQTRLARMTALQMVQFIVTTLAFAALIMAAILCLAEPPARPLAESSSDSAGESSQRTESERLAAQAAMLRHWERQSSWLNHCLYLSALLLGTCLLFINAFLRWPGFVLTEHGDYDAYIATLVSYYGFTFTVMLASFYIPVAAILTDRVKRLSASTQGETKLPNAFQGPLQILKIVLGLFSTSLAGVLPAIIDKLA